MCHSISLLRARDDFYSNPRHLLRKALFRIMKRKIVGFHKDEFGDWVADLECSHTQHVRHKPPRQNRPWVIDPAERKKRIGYELDCKKCDEVGYNQVV